MHEFIYGLFSWVGANFKGLILPGGLKDVYLEEVVERQDMPNDVCVCDG